MIRTLYACFFKNVIRYLLNIHFKGNQNGN